MNILQKSHNLLLNQEAILKRQQNVFIEQMNKKADIMFYGKLPFMGSELNEKALYVFNASFRKWYKWVKGHMPVRNINAF